MRLSDSCLLNAKAQRQIHFVKKQPNHITKIKKNKLWVNLSNLMRHQLSHYCSADKSLTDYEFCDFFSSREAIHKRYNESHICTFQYSNSHIKNKRKLMIVI